MRVYLIRHGVTKGNLEHRYVGSTEEVLLPEADEPLLSLKKRLEKDGCRKPHLLVSPMLRCRQSAEILFPGEKQTVVEDFRECDFGTFEYKNYEELNGKADYQRFLDSMGEAPFPGGESKKEFRKDAAVPLKESSGSLCLRRQKWSLWCMGERSWRFLTDFQNHTGIIMTGRSGMQKASGQR